jgi:putative Mg2+ transporter-C (MgtC) family protein
MLAAGITDVLREEFTWAGDGEVWRLVVRLVVAMVLGGILGYQREAVHKPAGLRTHMLVSLAAALFAITPKVAGMDAASVSRVIQGLAAGMGFIGGGAILKLSDRQQVRGLTTAASLWLATAVGVASGLGHYGAALVSAILGVLALGGVGWMEYRIEHTRPQGPPQGERQGG